MSNVSDIETSLLFHGVGWVSFGMGLHSQA